VLCCCVNGEFVVAVFVVRRSHSMNYNGSVCELSTSWSCGCWRLRTLPLSTGIIIIKSVLLQSFRRIWFVSWHFNREGMLLQCLWIKDWKQWTKGGLNLDALQKIAENANILGRMMFSFYWCCYSTISPLSCWRAIMKLFAHLMHYKYHAVFCVWPDC